MKGEQFMLPLVLLQAVSVFALWSLNSLDRVGQETFTLFLAIDLVAFALMAHVYRMGRQRREVERGWVLLASVAILALLFASLFLS